jgi:hypothetical protein
LKAPGSRDQTGAVAFEETRLCEDNRVSIESTPKNIETIDLEHEGVAVRSDNFYDPTAVANFQDGKLKGSRSDINHFDEKAQGKGDSSLSSDSDTVAVQVSNVSQAESHGTVATVAEGLEGAFEFLRDMRSVSWLDSNTRDFSSSEEDVLEELKRVLNQLEK